MGAIATLDQRELRVDPGSSVSVTLTVRNVGTVVDEFTFETLGQAGAWSTYAPTELRLLPGTEGTVVLTIQPPRTSDVASGLMAFGAKVHSREDPPGSAVEEGTLTIAPFEDIKVEIVPQTSEGPWRGRHEIALDNNSNHPVRVGFEVADKDEQLTFRYANLAEADRGQSVYLPLEVRPLERIWRGKPVRKPFELKASARGVDTITVPATYNQQPVFSRTVVRIAVLAVILLVALPLLWFFALKPTIEQVAEARLDEQSATINAQNEQIEQLQESLNEARQEAGLPTEEFTAPENVPTEDEPTENGPAPPPQGPTASAEEIEAAEVGPDGNLVGPDGQPLIGADGNPIPGDQREDAIAAALAAENGGGGDIIALGDGLVGTSLDFRLQAVVEEGDESTSRFAEQPQDDPENPPENVFFVGEGQVFRLTDIVLQNPNGHAGELRIMRNDETLLLVALQNFRDLDYHFIAPVTFRAGESLRLEVVCELVDPEALPPAQPQPQPTGTASPAPTPTPTPEAEQPSCLVGSYFGGVVQDVS